MGCLRFAVTGPARLGTSLLAAALLCAATIEPIHAQNEPSAAENSGRDDEVDTEHLFGFTEGADLGVVGEKELEQETTGRIGKRGFGFSTFDPTLALKVPLTDNFRLAPGISFYGYDIADGPGLPARTFGGFTGGFLEIRTRLLDRRTAPVGMTLSVVPNVGTIDAGSGLDARSFGTEAALLIDRELIPGRLVAAANISYAFARTRLTSTNERLLGSGLEVSGAVAYQAQPALFLGGEVRYARAYEGMGLDRFAGDAVYLGPTIYRTLSEHAWVSFTWSFQVAGKAIDERGPLDLTNFDRHQLRLRIGYSF